MILGVYGYAEAGKTELIEKLLRKLSSKYKVATIKHIPRDFSIDRVDSDTSKHKEAGAHLVVASSTTETTFTLPKALNLNQITQRLSEYDLVLEEGYKDAPIPKIAVGEIKHTKNTVMRYENNFDDVLRYIIDAIEIEQVEKKLPGLDCGDCGYSCKRLAKLIYRGKEKLNACPNLTEGKVKVEVDDNRLPVGRFVESIVSRTVLGMVSALRGVEKPKKVCIEGGI